MKQLLINALRNTKKIIHKWNTPKYDRAFFPVSARGFIYDFNGKWNKGK
jgi:hypothetical protein